MSCDERPSLNPELLAGFFALQSLVLSQALNDVSFHYETQARGPLSEPTPCALETSNSLFFVKYAAFGYFVRVTAECQKKNGLWDRERMDPFA